MGESFNIQEYMTKVVERVMADALKATWSNPKEQAFLLKFAASSRAGSRARAKAAQAGEHVPPLLIASITSSCNLHCAGCYARGIESTSDGNPYEQLTSGEWGAVFDEAEELGIRFVMLVGGEPLLRKDVVRAAARRPKILFPIFTNGTYIDDEYFDLFDRHRNLVPVISMEGGQKATDDRRGEGIYDLLLSNMEKFRDRHMVFGASITVTTENVREVSSDEFLGELADLGCRLVVYIEYVPTREEEEHLAPADPEREYLAGEIARLRQERPQMVYVSFPGDEKASGGCIAAGRGLFHINSHGGAEACPFSPYSDINVRDTSVKEALGSGLFQAIRDGNLLTDDHSGGCVLYEKRSQVEKLAAELAGKREGGGE
ncbi:MAG: radical SAM protein [Firmicutes bacterium]|nr:radical SAM protein [Bacillota bacterium]